MNYILSDVGLEEDFDVRVSRNEIENISIPTYSCNLCDYSTIDKSNMKRHMRQHTGERPYTHKTVHFVSLTLAILVGTNLPGFLEKPSAEQTVSPTFKGYQMLSCNFCEYKTYHKTNMNTHLRRHTGERPFVCIQSSNASLENDMGTFLAKFKVYDCIHCVNLHHERITEPSAKQFITTDAIAFTMHTCSYCKYETVYRSDLTKHMRKHTGERPFICKICGKSFAQNSNLKTHEQLHALQNLHVCNLLEFVHEVTSNGSGDNVENLKNHVCLYCGYVASYRSGLINHIRKHTGTLIPATNPNLNVSNVKRSSGSSRGPPMLSCLHCNYTTVHKSNFKAHLRKHTGERPFVCKICGNVSVREMKRRSFLENLGADDKQFPVIMKIKTETLTKFSCSFCGYITPYKTTMKNHIRKHTGERPFVCDICGRDFTRKQSLQLHHASHEKPLI
ncbi:zinc finger protein 711 [Trichonephila clavata]|uniref:Zinc finger protein 711 n=1 Tax=Trichonephila clavata TaxID=2740835 RepID=A0A8X6JA22_TRICU|nr:zinc finger protein 711 [Trichonephila clavata]